MEVLAKHDEVVIFENAEYLIHLIIRGFEKPQDVFYADGPGGKQCSGLVRDLKYVNGKFYFGGSNA